MASHSQWLTDCPFNELTNIELLTLFNNIDGFGVDDLIVDNELLDYITKFRTTQEFKEFGFDYFTDVQFNNRLSKSSVENLELSIFHLNIRSLNSKQRGLCQYLELLTIDFDVIVLSEIWSHNIEFYCNILPGYIFMYDLPLHSNVGGVGIYIKESLSPSEISKYKLASKDNIKVENIWIEICKNETKYIIGGIYRHPNNSIAEFQKSLDDVLHRISAQNSPCLLAGDFNIDLCKTERNKQTADYVDSLLINNFLPTIIMPTRITSRSSTLIDHIYYYEGSNNKKKTKVKSGNLLCDLSDHLPNYTLIMHEKINHTKTRPLIRLFSKQNKELFAKKTGIN